MDVEEDSVAPATLTVLHSFSGTDGQDPVSLIQASDGTFYGVTVYGGAAGLGTIFKIDASGNFTLLHSFSGPEGSSPGLLIQATDGSFCGTAAGPAGDGIVFRMDQSGNVTALHSFASSEGQGLGSLFQATDGSFYGTAYGGGATGDGTLFKMDSLGNVTVLHSFSSTGPEGAGPVDLIQGPIGALYGFTAYGGDMDCPQLTTGIFPGGCGTVFTMELTGNLKVLHVFAGGASDGDGSNGLLLQGRDGNLYGAAFGWTPAYGAYGFGLIFRISWP
jgi:uncharacterized repeat protein (TIGR03803 family)